MIDLLSSLSGTLLPALLFLSGVAFLLITVSSRLGDKIMTPAGRRVVVIGAILLIVGIGKPAPLKAQDAGMKSYTWEEYGLGFSIPSTFTVKSNTVDKFFAGDSNLVITILPWKDRSVTEPHDVALAAYKITPGVNKKTVEEFPLNNLNGLKGYVAYITAQQNGMLTHNYVAGFIITSNSTNFTVHLSWYDSEQTDNNSKIAINILSSFKALSQTSSVSNGLKKMTWSAYGIDFEIPQNFKIIRSDNNQYTGTTDSLVISINPFKDSTITDPVEIAQLGLDRTPGSNKKVKLEKNLQLNGFKCYVAYATATVEGELTHLVIAGLLNPADDTNFIVQLLFYNGTAEENERNMKLSFDILQTFKPQNK